MNDTLLELANAVEAAGTAAKALLADPHQAKSQFAAGIRSALDHAADLVALQKQWATANQTPVAPATPAAK